uniref:Uncharacterized protein n=1 Tax=Oryza meridionalis TaxID=40149 RepID=A0A0E0DZA2_9ORYZ
MEYMVFRAHKVGNLTVHIHICVPNLVSPSPIRFEGWTPLFESMTYLLWYLTMHVMMRVYTRTFETVTMKPVRVAMPLLITKMELKISIRFDDELLNMANRIIISEHLRKLKLDSLKLKCVYIYIHPGVCTPSY